MYKKIWRYILNNKDTQELIVLCKNFNIQIPGFRNNSVPKKNVDRRIIITAILKPENFKKLDIDKNINNYEEYQIESILNESEPLSLQEIATTQYVPSKVLEILLVNQKFEEAENLFKFLTINYTENELTSFEKLSMQSSTYGHIKKFTLKEETNKKETAHTSEVTDDKVIKKLNEKISNLKEELDKTHVNNKKLKEELSIEKREKNTEIKKFKDENNNLQKIIKSSEEKLLTLQTENSTLQELINSLESEVTNLKKLLEENQNKLLTNNEVIQAIQTDNKQKNNNPNITIIGKPSNSIIDSCNINFTVLDKKQTFNTDLSNQDEIWILSYQVDKKIEKELKEIGLQKPIKLISTFIELKQEIQRGIILYDDQPVGS